MTNVTIITATRGIGLSLDKYAKIIGLNTETYGIGSGNIGISNNLPAQVVDHYIDINEESNLDTIKFNPSHYLIWSTGAFLKIPLEKMNDSHIFNLSELHYNMPLRLIRRFHQQQQDPYHFVVIASCSSWRLREQEAVYCGLSAAKATFARNMAADLAKERPGSKVTLLNPGGIRTPFYYEEDVEGEDFIDQVWLSKYIWDSVFSQEDTFSELQILRKKPQIIGEEPIVERGQRMPEVWSN